MVQFTNNNVGLDNGKNSTENNVSSEAIVA